LRNILVISKNSIKLVLNDNDIHKVHMCNYLGLYFDDQLKWRFLIDYVYNRLLQLIGIGLLLVYNRKQVFRPPFSQVSTDLDDFRFVMQEYMPNGHGRQLVVNFEKKLTVKLQSLPSLN